MVVDSFLISGAGDGTDAFMGAGVGAGVTDGRGAGGSSRLPHMLTVKLPP